MMNTTDDFDGTSGLPNRSELEETTVFGDSITEEGDSLSKGGEDSNRRVGLVLLGNSPSMSDESHERLRNRLQVSALLLGSGLFVYLLLKMFNLYETSASSRPLLFWVHLATTIATLGVAWRLSVNCKFTLHHLRIVEFIVFCGPALLFTLVSPAILADSIKAGFVTDITSPWLLLIFTYTVLIPNTWQRAAMVIIPLSLIPIGLAFTARLSSETFATVLQTDPNHQKTFIRICMGMTWGAAIAIWGVWSIRSLRREAFEARKMGQYQLKQLLGRGGMGEVYLAVHRMLKRPCALKLIRPDVADIQRNLKRFEREVQSTARLTHWNTIEIFDYGNTEDGIFYYVMEYLPGMNLESLCSNPAGDAFQNGDIGRGEICWGILSKRRANASRERHSFLAPSTCFDVWPNSPVRSPFLDARIATTSGDALPGALLDDVRQFVTEQVPPLWAVHVRL